MQTMEQYYYVNKNFPLKIFFQDQQLIQINFQRKTPIKHNKNYSKNKMLKKIIHELDLYFAKKSQNFTIPLQLSGSAFTIQVLKAIQDIPYGKTATYGELANKIGLPKAARAVGLVVHRNSFPILIPCHRVVSANGIGGFSAGIKIKEKLLKLEGIKIITSPLT